MKTLYFLLMTFMLAFVTVFTASATKYLVNVSNYSFTPASISNVQLGDTIRWVWVSGNHTTTSTSIPAGAAAWDELINSSHTSYEYKPTLTGTYNYKCTPHVSMGMVGSFTVVGAAPTLNVTPSSRSVTAIAGNTDFSVVSNTNWTAVSDAGWCTVTPSGTGNGTITATYETNPTVTERTATITVSVSGLSLTVSVIQDGSNVSIIESSLSSLIIYPNPAKDRVIIKTGSAGTQLSEISVYNFNGALVMPVITSTSDEIMIDLNDVPEGIYFIRMISGKLTEIRKMVVTR